MDSPTQRTLQCNSLFLTLPMHGLGVKVGTQLGDPPKMKVDGMDYNYLLYSLVIYPIISLQPPMSRHSAICVLQCR